MGAMNAATVRCERCGHAAAADDIFCGYCNHKLPEFAMAMPPPAELEPAGDEPEHARPARTPPPWWKIGAAVGALLVVVIVAVVALGGDDAPPAAPEAALAAMRRAPAQQWKRSIDGTLVGHFVDDEHTLALELTDQQLVVSALAAATGETLWEHTIEPSPLTDLSVADDVFAAAQPLGDDIVIVLGAVRQPHRDVVVLDGGTGDERWRDETATDAFGFVGPGVIGSLGSDRLVVEIVDDSAHRVADAIDVGQVFATADATYADDGTAITRLFPVNGPSFAFEHTDSVASAAGVEGGLVIGTGDRVTSVSSIGTRRWSVNGRVGAVSSVLAMNGDQLLVNGASGIRVISSVDGSDVTNNPSDFPFATVGAGPNGHDVVFAFSTDSFDPTKRAGVAALSAGSSGFTRLADLSGFSLPLIQSAGSVVYVTEGQRTDETERTIAAFELPGGRSLWSMPIAQFADAIVTADGLLLVDSGDDPAFTFFAPAAGG
jgi:hypothetical protein